MYSFCMTWVLSRVTLDYRCTQCIVCAASVSRNAAAALPTVLSVSLSLSRYVPAENSWVCCVTGFCSCQHCCNWHKLWQFWVLLNVTRVSIWLFSCTVVKKLTNVDSFRSLNSAIRDLNNWVRRKKCLLDSGGEMSVCYNSTVQNLKVWTFSTQN